MTTFQFIFGMIFCLALLTIRAYLTIQNYRNNDRNRPKNK